MNFMLKIALPCLGLAAIGATGCKVTECTETAPDGGTTKTENCLKIQTTVEYRDMRSRAGGQAWTSGRSVSITNYNGPLKVALGNAADERVQFLGTAFTRETNDADGAQKAKDHLGALADPSFSGGESISLVAPGGGLAGYSPFDGYDLTVWLPPDFDAALTVINNNGTTMLYGADGTTSTTVTSHEIIATDLKRTINLHSTVGDIDVGAVPSGPGNVVRTDLGKITARIGAANLAISATSDSGIVTFPTAWTTQMVAADKMSGTATLGDGSGVLTVSTGGGNISFFTQ